MTTGERIGYAIMRLQSKQNAEERAVAHADQECARLCSGRMFEAYSTLADVRERRRAKFHRATTRLILRLQHFSKRTA